jgi:uncharacterized RDD family membrane protein YckC
MVFVPIAVFVHIDTNFYRPLERRLSPFCLALNHIRATTRYSQPAILGTDRREIRAVTTSGEQVQSSRNERGEFGKIGDTNIIGRRVIAVTIDTLIIILGLSVLLVSVIQPVIELNLVVFLLSAAAGQFFYFYVLEGLIGRTIGKFLTRIEVCREDGSRIDFGDSFTRNIWRFVDSVLSYGVGFFIATSSDRKQRFGDKRANTLVVRR